MLIKRQNVNKVEKGQIRKIQITSAHNLESIIAKTDATPLLPPSAVSQLKDEHRRHPVATVCAVTSAACQDSL
jgi:hypothetical protein